MHGLDGLEKLDTLNVSSNIIKSLDGIGNVPNITNLYISRNFLRTADDMSPVMHCSKLIVLDVSENRLEEDEVRLT